MSLWTTEYGTLWAWETGNGLPPLCAARTEAVFAEVDDEDIDDLAVAMNLPGPQLIQQRLRERRRRCFCLKVEGQNADPAIATYGWVTQGVECVGELEREFHIRDNEAYIWDCGTILAWRGQGFYSALLSHLIYQLHDEGVARIWIGASRLNQPSIRGFVNAGFQPVVDCTYHRFYRFSLLWVQQGRSSQNALVPAAYRILLNEHERRWGQLIVGFKS